MRFSDDGIVATAEQQGRDAAKRAIEEGWSNEQVSKFLSWEIWGGHRTTSPLFFSMGFERVWAARPGNSDAITRRGGLQ